MKKRHMIRTVAILLVLSLCLSVLPSSVLAVPVGKSTDSDSPTLEDFYAGNATAEDLYGKLDEAIVPEIIGYETAVAKNHVGRLYEDEGTDLNKVVFLNVDGSKTMYLFDFPVKYVDETGSIQDIRLEIADGTTESGKFQTAANDAVTRFPAKFTDGISLEGNDTEIRLVPVLTTANSGTATMATNSMTTNAVANATAQRIDKNTIEYRYDNKTTVEYSLTYTGFKEDIVVSEYTGQTTYPFRLYTNGLALEEMDGSYYLVDDDDNIKATIGNIIIFTADERNNAFGDIVPTTIVEDEEYLLNIVVDANYLADPDTIYPIRIDPTIEINYDNNGGSAIEDITISTNKNFSGSHDSLYVGRRSTEGIARALMRFPGLNLSNLADATVTSATVQLRDLMCESDALAISCHVFTGNVWDANSATWSNVSPNSYVSTAMSTNTMSWSIGKTHSPVHWYSFDISSAVQGWIDDDYTQSKGIIFKVASSVENGSTIANRTFGSFNRASYKPSLSITYVGIGSSFETAENFRPSTNSVLIEAAGEKRYYKFTPETSGEYMFYSTPLGDDFIGDPVVNLYNGNYQLIDDGDDEAYNRNFRIAANLIAGSTYYFELGHYGTNTGAYIVNVTKAENLSGRYYFKNLGSLRYMDIHGPVEQELVHQWSFSAGNQTKWTATKQSDGYYTIQSLYGDKKYIGISDTYSSEGNIVLFSSISDECRWKIYRDYYGNLIFEPKNAPGKVLCAPDNYAGTELGLSALSSDVENRSFWEGLQYKYDYTIAHYYDEGFVERFPNEVSQINTYHDICSDALLAVFGVSTDRSIQSYTSCADSCVGSPVTLAKTLNLCSHSATHKTCGAILIDMGNQFGYGSSTTTRCIWTGHLLEQKNSCSFKPPYNTMIMNLLNVTDANHQNITGDLFIKQVRLIELIHEASHQLGATDHYCYDPSGNNCNNPNNSCWRCDLGLADEPNCIMSSHFYDIEDMVNDGTITDIYCDECRSSTHNYGIEKHLKEHHG